MLHTRFTQPLLLAALFAAGAAGCASARVVTPPIHTEAALGRVVVYRNGVAYFERRATVKGNQLTLEVPGQRLDDFLKSLTIEDVRTKKLVPISFPTLDDRDEEVTIELELPKDGVHELKITYVTESPAWKPSYRLELHGDAPANLEAWAVVHNVSGEDWKHVAVGVGSTSALSFKYDLRSVHFVDRETLSDETALGVAPPTGGSPYQVANKEVELLGSVRRPAPPPPSRVALESAGGRRAAHGAAAAAPAVAPPEAKADAATASEARGAGDGLAAVAERARGIKQKIRVEGYARPGDDDKKSASLANANQVRDRLIRDGVPPAQIEVVATGQASEGDTARVLAVGSNEAVPLQPGATSPDAPLGDAYFLTQVPLDIDKDHSAMVNVLSSAVHAESVYLYDPISARGSKRFAFRAVLFDNPTEHTLDPGPVTVYAEGQFLGEGLSDPIQPKSRAFVPYSLDRKVLVDAKDGTREEVERLVTAERGVLRTEARRFRTTELELTNRGFSPAIVYVRHAVADGYELVTPASGVEKFRDAYLVPVKLAAGATAHLKLEEVTPIHKSVDIRTEPGIAELKVFLQARASRLEPATRAALEQVVELHRQMAALDEQRETAVRQSETYRERIGELDVELVSLRRVAQAQAVSHHLAQKMEEMSQRLQKLTLEIADIDGKLLAGRVTLEDRLAELTLGKPNAVAAR